MNVATSWNIKCRGFSEIYLYPEDYLDCNTEEEVRNKIEHNLDVPDFKPSYDMDILCVEHGDFYDTDYEEFIEEWKKLKNIH